MSDMQTQRNRQTIQAGDQIDSQLAVIAAALDTMPQCKDAAAEVLTRVLREHPFARSFLLAILDPFAYGLSIKDLADALKAAGRPQIENSTMSRRAYYEDYVRIHTALTEVRNVVASPTQNHPHADKIVGALAKWEKVLFKKVNPEVAKQEGS